MNLTVLILALPVAAIAAFRGIWSPCGLSMLSSITPMTEAGRGNRFTTTATWFVVGSVLGGLSIGAVAALGAAGIAMLDLTDATIFALIAVAGLLTAAIDFGLAGDRLPIFKRQVNDAWLRTYRSWVYGAGFGWQIGFGVATYIMTGGVFLTIAIAVLAGQPALALVIGATFGLVRGSAVFIGRSAVTPAALSDVHARLDAAAPAARDAAAWVQVSAAAAAAAIAWHPAASLVIFVGFAALSLGPAPVRLVPRSPN